MTAAARPPSSFRMEALLQEMRDMETLVPRQAPPVASLATSGGSRAAPGPYHVSRVLCR